MCQALVWGLGPETDEAPALRSLWCREGSDNVKIPESNRYTLESPLNSKDIQPVHPKGNHP